VVSAALLPDCVGDVVLLHALMAAAQLATKQAKRQRIVHTTRIYSISMQA